MGVPPTPPLHSNRKRPPLAAAGDQLVSEVKLRLPQSVRNDHYQNKMNRNSSKPNYETEEN